MTAQRMEVLIYEEEGHSLGYDPLYSYLKTYKNSPEFTFIDTGCCRGYSGTWEIRESKLFLVEIHGLDKEGNELDNDQVFHDEKTVFIKTIVF